MTTIVEPETVSSVEYSFTADPSAEVLQINSPVSGAIEYKYDVPTGQWLSVEDKHDFRGLITRDLLRHALGVPDFR